MVRDIGPYGRLAALVLAHRRLVGVAVTVLTVVSLFLGIPPKIDPDLVNLLPEQEPSVVALHQLYEDGGGVHFLSLTYGSDDPEKLDHFLDGLAERFAARPDVEFAVHEIDPDLAFRIGMLQFRREEIDELVVRLQGALALGSALNPIVMRRLMDMGPLTERIANVKAPTFLTGDSDTGRLMIRPTGLPNDPSFAQPFMADVEAMLAEAEAAEPGVKRLWVGGPYRHAVEDVKGIQRDLLRTSIASALLVLSIIVVGFRSVRGAVLVFLPLVVANAVNMAVVYLFMGTLNTFTSFSTAILFGLGIDFAVHLVGRYREELARGRTAEEAVVVAWDRVGPPCTTAALTSAAGFLALTVADFKGFSQLGTLLAIGLMVCLAAMLVVLPLLLPVLDARSEVLLGTRTQRLAPSQSSYRLAPIGLMVATIATFLIGSETLPKVAFEYDISTMRRDGLAYDELAPEQQKLARSSYQPVVVTYPDRVALEVGQRAFKDALAAGELPHVAGAVSIESLMPLDQRDRLEGLGELQALLDHPNLRYLPPVLVERLMPLKGRDLKPITMDELPAPLTYALGLKTEGRQRLLVLPKGNMWDVREAAEMEREVQGIAGDLPVAGENISVATMYHLARRDMPWVGALALALVMALASIDLRKAHWVAGAMGTLIAGLVWAGAAVQTAGVKLSMVNVVGLPILVGIGVDVVIHLLHRLAEEGPGGVRRALSTTGVAATLSTVTTIASFAALMLAGNRGIRSLGILVVVGLTAVFVASAVLLPLAWAAGWRMTGRSPDVLRAAGSSERDAP